MFSLSSHIAIGFGPMKRTIRSGVVIHSDGTALDIEVGHSTTAYLRTIIQSEVDLRAFCAEYYGGNCLDGRHCRDWLDWHTQPNARTAWAIGEALHRCGVKHASGTLMLLASGRLTHFIETFVGLDFEIAFRYRRRLRRLLSTGLDAVRGTLYDNVCYGDVAGLPIAGGGIERHREVRSITKVIQSIDFAREAGFLRRRQRARQAWEISRELRTAFSESFSRRLRGHMMILERYAEGAMAIATRRMNAFDREELVLEALLNWLRDRETSQEMLEPRWGVLTASAIGDGRRQVARPAESDKHST